MQCDLLSSFRQLSSIYNSSENTRVFKHGMNRSIYTAGSLLLFLRLCIIIPTKDDVGGIHRK